MDGEKNLEVEEDKTYWNVVKGVGIVLVVTGHACSGSVLAKCIYLFHLPLFFFVSGYLYNEGKYGDDPFANIAARIKSSWIKYILVFWGLILLHNLFLKLGMLDVDLIWEPVQYYTKEDILSEMAKAVLGMGDELMGGTLWFVPVVVMSSGLLGVIVSFSRRVFNYFHKLWMKYAVQMVAVMFCAIVGYIAEMRQMKLVANMQVVLVVMPFLWVGYFFRNHIQINMKKYGYVVPAALCGIFIYAVSRKYSLDLIYWQVYPYMWIVALAGIYICLTIAKNVTKFRIIRRLFELFGANSFMIMFLHFPILRIIDWGYTVIFQQADLNQYRIMPIAYPQLWPVYILAGLGIPTLLYLFVSKVKKCDHMIGK